MIFQSFSKKQLQALSWWYRGSPYASYTAVICDGAVRSGKTLCMSISFFLWAFYQFQNQSFAFCGKTIRSLRRNLITPVLPILKELGFQCHIDVYKRQPGTQSIYLEAIRRGWVEIFIEAGAVFSTPTCGPCLGGHMGILGKGERAVSTTNRNFVGRMGHIDSEIYRCV